MDNDIIVDVEEDDFDDFESNEDAGCNNPCGLEPMGCSSCGDR